MESNEFAQAVREERDALMSSLANPSGWTVVGDHLLEAGLSQSQRNEVLAAIEGALTDGLYTFLLALDGSVSLGGTQQHLMVSDDSGNGIASETTALKPRLGARSMRTAANQQIPTFPNF